MSLFRIAARVEAFPVESYRKPVPLHRLSFQNVSGPHLDPDTLRKILIYKLGKHPLTEDDYLDKEDRLEKFHPHKLEIDPAILTQILVKKIGHLYGFDVYIVNGKKIRGRLDVDFTIGGNPGRYAYVPNNQIWIESRHDPSDWGAALLHEFVECYLMTKYGIDYSGAHDIANIFEWELRTRIEIYNTCLTESNVIPTINLLAGSAIKLIESCIQHLIS